jgi:hypothetical protein
LHIREELQDHPLSARFELHTGGDNVDADIRLYLVRKLRQVGNRRGYDDWPRLQDIDALVQRAGGLFIYASTAVQYISSGLSGRELIERLSRVLDGTMQTPGTPGTPGTMIYNLYRQVLEEVSQNLDPSELDEVRVVLATIICAEVPLSMNAITLLLDGLASPKLVLSMLNSVVAVPSSENVPLRIHHASFADYLINTASPFSVDVLSHNKLLALKCLECMNKYLRENLCGIEELDATNNTAVYRDSIQDGVVYACCCWALHIRHGVGSSHQSSFVDEILLVVRIFFKEHLLHWIEVMSLLRQLKGALECIQNMSQVLSGVRWTLIYWCDRD